MKSLSNWRSVRVLESRLERELRQRHSLGLHGICIGFFTLGLMWGVSHPQMVMGVDSLALRYLVSTRRRASGPRRLDVSGRAVDLETLARRDCLRGGAGRHDGPFRSCGELFAASHQAGQGAAAIA